MKAIQLESCGDCPHLESSRYNEERNYSGDSDTYIKCVHPAIESMAFRRVKIRNIDACIHFKACPLPDYPEPEENEF